LGIIPSKCKPFVSSSSSSLNATFAPPQGVV